MKKFFAFVCAIALGVGFSACTKLGNAKLAGTWNSSTCSWTEDGESGTDDITGELTFVFFEDGDFIVYDMSTTKGWKENTASTEKNCP